MKIATRAAEKKPANRGEDGIAEIAMQCGHGPRPDAALEAIAHHKLIALAKLLDERGEPGEVVAVVGITHDDVGAACGTDAADKRASVAPLRDIDNPRPVSFGNRPRAVRAPIVGNHDLANYATACQKRPRLGHALPDRLSFIKARHHDA